jgi:hypothetical protein
LKKIARRKGVGLIEGDVMTCCWKVFVVNL